jgi:hypothetical protein
MWWMLIRIFLLAPIIPAFRSRSLRLERMAGSPQSGGDREVRTAA